MRLIELLAYFDLFNHPLTREEILAWIEVAENEWSNPQIETKDQFFFLRGRSKLVELRQKRQQHTQKLWRKIWFFLRILKYVPFLRLVNVCNTLAFNYADKDSDIDLFIVTTPRRLWTTRLLVTFLLQILGVRRHHDKIAGRFCLSFWCTEEALNLEKIQIAPSDPHFVFWILAQQPVLDNTNLYKNFIQTNHQWIKAKYGLNQPQKFNAPVYHSNFLTHLGEYLLQGKWGDFVERKIRGKLKPRAKKKAALATSEASLIISDQMLKFHNRDTRQEITQKFQAKLGEMR